jgi:ubiquinone/menaquinone biosynthesis C-methylase UbiE
MHLSPILYQKIVRPKFSTDKYIKNIIKLDFDFDNAKVLDFGCGTGSSSYIFKDANYLGVDVDKERINFATKALPQYKFKVIEENILPVESESIDYICIFATLHHIDNKKISEYIKEFKRVLKAGGKIIGIEPVFSNNHKFNNWFMRIFDDGKYIRREEEYASLFGKYFAFSSRNKFKKFFFYNELYFSLTAK